jgi:CRISPR system Cascade subunit CasE
MTQSPHYLLELPINSKALIGFIHDCGLNTASDEDLGYAAHAWLKALFGPHAPNPYRLLHDLRNRRAPRILAYSERPREELTEHAETYARPMARAVCNLDDLRVAKLPEVWKVGRRLGFEVLACPVSRQDQSEKDVFLRRASSLPTGAPKLERSAVYYDWLKSQAGLSVDIENLSLEGFRLIHMLRRRQDGERKGPRITRPHVLFHGVLTIRDGEGFDRVLRRGIGRHRAFGYGMLLLRPAP